MQKLFYVSAFYDVAQGSERENKYLDDILSKSERKKIRFCFIYDLIFTNIQILMRRTVCRAHSFYLI